MATIESTRAVKTWAGHYSFAIDGGHGTITLRSEDGPIPVGSIVTGGYLEVTTQLNAGAGGTAALQVEGANDTVTATIYSSSPWSSTGRKDIIPDATGSTAIKTTAARSPAVVVAVNDLSAGVFNLVLFYR